MSVLAAAKASGNRDAIAKAERALDAAEAKAKKTSAGKAAGGEQQRPRQQREVPPRTSSARPGPGEPPGFLVVTGQAKRVPRPDPAFRCSLLLDSVSPLAPLSLPFRAGSIVTGDGSFCGDAWNKERSRISHVKTVAKSKLEATKAAGEGVAAAQAAFDAAEASRVAHNLLPHVRGKSHSTGPG